MMERKQIRNWRANSLNARNDRLERLQKVLGPNAPVMFCPRCGTQMAWDFAERAKEYDFRPFTGEHASYCGDCQEHFVIRSVACPYGGRSGWDARRVLAIATRIFVGMRAA